MAELQGAQQAALSTLSLGLGQQGAAPGGSSTETFNGPQQFQPINFSQLQNQAPASLAVTITTATNLGVIDVPTVKPLPVEIKPVLTADVSGTHAIVELLHTTGSGAFDVTPAGECTFTHLNCSTASASLESITWSGSGVAPLPSGLSAVLASALTTSVSIDSTISGTIATKFSAPDQTFDFLAAGETLTITYNVTVTDNSGASLTQPVTITVTGSNDAPVLAADASGPHTTIQAVQTSGTLTFTDVDLTDHHTASTSVISTTWPSGVTPPSGTDAVLAGALSATVVDNTGPGSGSIAFTFDAGNALDFLGFGQKLTIIYNVTVTDDSGVSSTQPGTITDFGTNAAPTLKPVTGPTYTDTSALDHFNAVSGTLLGADIDAGTTLTYGVVGGTADNSLSGYNQSLTGTFGTLHVNTATGAYTFVPNDTTINALTAATTENFIFTVSDGSLSAQQNFTVTINGAAPTVSISDGTPNPATEGTDPRISFTVTLSEPADQNVTAGYHLVNGTAVAGSDFTDGSGGTVTILAGQTTATIAVNVINNNVLESPEAFTVVLDSATYGSGTPNQTV